VLSVGTFFAYLGYRLFLSGFIGPASLKALARACKSGWTLRSADCGKRSKRAAGRTPKPNISAFCSGKWIDGQLYSTLTTKESRGFVALPASIPSGLAKW